MQGGMDQQYSRIVEGLDWDKPQEHIEELRRLAGNGHQESMNLLAILLGDVDSRSFRNEIISLYERSHMLGSLVAANSLSIQYEQWNEIENSLRWKAIAAQREK